MTFWESLNFISSNCELTPVDAGEFSYNGKTMKLKKIKVFDKTFLIPYETSISIVDYSHNDDKPYVYIQYKNFDPPEFDVTTDEYSYLQCLHTNDTKILEDNPYIIGLCHHVDIEFCDNKLVFYEACFVFYEGDLMRHEDIFLFDYKE